MLGAKRSSCACWLKGRRHAVANPKAVIPMGSVGLLRTLGNVWRWPLTRDSLANHDGSGDRSGGRSSPCWRCCCRWSAAAGRAARPPQRAGANVFAVGDCVAIPSTAPDTLRAHRGGVRRRPELHRRRHRGRSRAPARVSNTSICQRNSLIRRRRGCAWCPTSSPTTATCSTCRSAWCSGPTAPNAGNRACSSRSLNGSTSATSRRASPGSASTRGPTRRPRGRTARSR